MRDLARAPGFARVRDARKEGYAFVGIAGPTPVPGLPKYQLTSANAADFVHRLKRISEEERQTILTRTAGALSPEEADELERVIEEGCEKIDEHDW